MQHLSEGAGRRANGAGHCPHHPAALGLLARHARHHPQLLCRRNFAHGLDFNSLGRYNDANLVAAAKSFSGPQASNYSSNVLSQGVARDPLSTNPEFKINDADLKFLKSLRIKIEEEK